MKAIVVEQFGHSDVMQLKDRQAPQPLNGQVQISIKAIGVNPVDTYIRSGLYPLKPELPYTPGLDAAGVITAVGENVDPHQIGRRVYLFGSETGCYAETAICRQDQVYALPDNVDFAAGAALGVPYSTAYYAINYRAHAVPGETILIHGASGAVGLAAIQIARSQGLKVIGTAGSEEGIKLIKEQGVFAALNHNATDYLADIDQLTCGGGINIVLEMLANVNLAKDLKVLSKFGRIVIIGNRGTVEIDPRDTMGKNASIMGMSLFNTSRQELSQIHAALYAGLSDGRFKPVIHSTLPLVEAPKSHNLVMQGGINGKIILTP
ncbi:MAG: NADPH:quinone reductase [Desulfuromonadales bacterium]|nr:NADPH:quinone reductase [Desulfuromonadales bacterium]